MTKISGCVKRPKTKIKSWTENELQMRSLQVGCNFLQIGQVAAFANIKGWVFQVSCMWMEHDESVWNLDCYPSQLLQWCEPYIHTHTLETHCLNQLYNMKHKCTGVLWDKCIRNMTGRTFWNKFGSYSDKKTHKYFVQKSLQNTTEAKIFPQMLC